jgi:NADPH2:quinone reductase
MPKAVRIHNFGGPEAMRIEEVDIGSPGPGQVRLRQTAIGLNFIDVYYRTGLYSVPTMPATLGVEAAGVVDALGEGVSEFRVGDRVAYAGVLGAYAEMRLIQADRLVKLPDRISDQQAAGMMLKGLTAHYLIRRTYEVQKGDTILVQAAAGGVGLILCQWARHLGATVIGTAGNDDKAALAHAHGCNYPIIYTREDFVRRTKELTKGEGVPVVYDSVGKDTFDRSLDCLRPLGLMALFGQSSGKVPPVDLGILASKGSLFITRPTLATYVAKRADLLAAAAELFDKVMNNIVKIEARQTYKLADIQQAHRDLESRKTTGSTVILV